MDLASRCIKLDSIVSYTYLHLLANAQLQVFEHFQHNTVGHPAYGQSNDGVLGRCVNAFGRIELVQGTVQPRQAHSHELGAALAKLWLQPCPH